MPHYIYPTEEAGKQFYQKYHNKGKVVMLNLLKFRKQADYTGIESLKPQDPITGEQAYQLYMKHTTPILQAGGGKLLFYGETGHFVIGPEAEHWDLVLLVEHASATKFIEFAQNEEYLKTAGHRTAALEDSRLLPMDQKA